MKRPMMIAFTLLVTWTGFARAQDDPRKAQAEALFRQGLELHDKDREAEALERFEKSYSSFPNPNALYWIAREEHLLGRTLAALRHYREAARHPLVYAKNLELARKYIAELEPRYARVTLTGPAGAQVKIGDKALRLPADDVIDVDPGPMTVRGEREGVQYEAKGVAVAGESLALELRSAVVSEAAGSSGSLVGPPPAAADRTSWTTGKTLGVAGWVLGGAALVAGVVFTTKANDAADTASALRAKSPNPDRDCFAATSADCEARKTADERRVSNTNLAVASFVASGVLVGAAAAVFLLWPNRSDSPSGRARVVPFAAGSAGGLLFMKEF